MRFGIGEEGETDIYDKRIKQEIFYKHPLKEFSAARFEYSLYGMPEVEKLANKAFKPDSNDLRDEAMIEAADTPEELLKCMRKGLLGSNRRKLREKVLAHEVEMKPLIKKRAITNLQDFFIENTLYFFLHCDENCCDWIMEQYDNMHSEYLKSLLCLVLGFRGDCSAVPFLMEEVERYERWYPNKDYDQGPLLALYELRDRFR